MTDPQSWNRHGYAMNNPTTLTDPLGLQGCPGWAGAWQCIEPHHMFAGPPGVRLGFLWGGSGWVFSAVNSIQWTETITTYKFRIVTVHGTSAVVTIDGVPYDDSLWAPGVTYWIPTGKVIDEIQFIQASAGQGLSWAAIPGVLAPMTSGALQAAKQAAQGRPTQTIIKIAQKVGVPNPQTAPEVLSETEWGQIARDTAHYLHLALELGGTTVDVLAIIDPRLMVPSCGGGARFDPNCSL